MDGLEVKNTVPSEKIYFSREQYEYLNRIFPEMLPTPDMSSNKVFMSAGSRLVVFHIRDRVK